MLTYNLLKYSENYSKTSGSLWQYYRDERNTDDAILIADFTAGVNNDTFKFKQAKQTTMA